MIFTSLVFALFFIIVASLYYLLPGKLQWVWILLSSLFFYVYSNPVYILVPCLIIAITYIAGIKIEKKGIDGKISKFYLVAIIINICLLVFFKYINFFTASAFDTINFFRQKSAEPLLTNTLLVSIIAPLGISYITFQAIGYLIEIKRGNHISEKNLGHFSAYLLFFPKIIAGPVERAHNFLPQIKKPQTFDYNNISLGVKLIIWGLFKKLVIADRLSIYVSAVFNNASHHAGITLLIATIFYVFQIYADFSGYTDMARGCARVLGFNLMQNFNRPLLAKSVTEFWRKWHISLSTWFADYVYSPIAIGRRDWGNWGIVYTFLITFTILGFWHGPNWTYIIFGGLQGLLLAIEFFTRKKRKAFWKNKPRVISIVSGTFFTFGYFAFSLIFFRANSVADAVIIIKRMFTIKGPLFIENFSIILFSLSGIIFLTIVELKEEYFNSFFALSNNKYWIIRNFYYCFLIVVILIAGVFDGGEFIYFQF